MKTVNKKPVSKKPVVKRKRRAKWDVSSHVNDNGSVSVYSMVNDTKDCWLMNKTYFFYSEKEARVTFIEDALNQGLKLETLR
jgi:hypothetical protein